MKRHHWLLLGLLLTLAFSQLTPFTLARTASARFGRSLPHPAPIVAQAPASPIIPVSPTSTPVPTLAPTPIAPSLPTTPSTPAFPTFPPATPLPGTSSPAPTIPPLSPPGNLPVPTFPSTAPPASTAPPLPLAPASYTDPAGRYKVGILEGYTASPLAGSVLVESPDGSLAYAVVTQSQPTDNPIGLVPTFLNVDALAQVATTVFQRGENFQPGAARAEAGGGAVMDWTGTLTIAGKSQPVGGSILIRPSPRSIVLLLISATANSNGQVPNALAALAPTLQPL